MYVYKINFKLTFSNQRSIGPNGELGVSVLNFILFTTTPFLRKFHENIKKIKQKKNTKEKLYINRKRTKKTKQAITKLFDQPKAK